MNENEITEKNITDFIYLSNLEIYFRDNKFMSIGLKYGESKKLLCWFNRNKQIKILNHIQDNFNLYRDLIINRNEVIKN